MERDTGSGENGAEEVVKKIMMLEEPRPFSAILHLRYKDSLLL